MKSWKLVAPKTLELVKTPSENPGPTQVKIKIEQTTISLPDIHSYLGSNEIAFPITLGRSCVGMVTDTGARVSFLRRGDEVFISSKKVCKQCSACKGGNPLLCENSETYGFDTDGFQRDFVIVDEDDCIPLPSDRFSNNEAIFLDSISLAIQVLNVLGIKKGDYLAISGAGLIGNILGMVALYYQIVPIIIDSSQERLDIAGNLGLYYTINTATSNAKEKVFHITGGKMVSYIAVVSSSDVPIEESLSLAHAGAKIATVERKGITTTYACPLSALQDNSLSICGVNSGMNFSVAINILATKAINVLPLIEREIPFDKVPETFEEIVSHPEKNHLGLIVKV